MAKDIRENLLFESVAVDDIENFLAAFPSKTQLKKGEVLWRQDDPGNSMGLLVSGRLEVVIDTHDTQPIAINIEAGAVIGEVCVFGQQRRSADVRAVRDSELILIDGEKFRERIKNKEVSALQMSYNIAKLLTQRLSMANNLIRKLQKIPDKAVIKSELEHYRQRFFEESLFN